MNLHIQLHRTRECGVAEVRRELGYGGAATVSCGAMSTNKLVVDIALKVFPPNSEAFAREFSAMRALSHPFSHPYIIDFIGTSELGRKDVIVLPFMPRGSLDKYLKDNPDADRARLIHQVGEALRYMHDDVGLVHGDIKCQNVLVDHNGNVQLADFGQTASLRGPTFPVSDAPPGGTLRFMAPELLVREAPVTPASDVYAFGSLIYQAFTGNTPWHDVTDSGAIWAIYCGRSPPRSKAIPRFFWGLSKRCWRRQPGRRPRMRDIVPLMGPNIGIVLPTSQNRNTQHNYQERPFPEASVLLRMTKLAWGGWKIISARQVKYGNRKPPHAWNKLLPTFTNTGKRLK